MGAVEVTLRPAKGKDGPVVTENGNPTETVIGWITNDIINDNAKV